MFRLLFEMGRGHAPGGPRPEPAPRLTRLPPTAFLARIGARQRIKSFARYQVGTVPLPSPLSAKACGQVGPFDHTAHCFVRGTEKGAGDRALIPSGLYKRVSANGHCVVQVAVAP